MNGCSVPEETKTGVSFLRKAAAGGDMHAVNILAALHRYRVGVQENKRKALVYYKHAAEGGH